MLKTPSPLSHALPPSPLAALSTLPILSTVYSQGGSWVLVTASPEQVHKIGVSELMLTWGR